MVSGFLPAVLAEVAKDMGFQYEFYCKDVKSFAPAWLSFADGHVNAAVRPGSNACHLPGAGRRESACARCGVCGPTTEGAILALGSPFTLQCL